MLIDGQVVAIRFGTHLTRKSRVFYRFEELNEDDAEIAMDFYLWVIRSGDNCILLDTGFDPEDGLRRGRVCLVDPISGLAAVGVEPGDVSLIVVSHCHYDHIGNLSRFPKATIVIQEEEYAFWTGPGAQRRHFRELTNWREMEWLSRVGPGRIELVDGDTELVPSVRLIKLNGHTPGSQGVVVKGSDRDIVLSSDAAHFYREVAEDLPFTIFSHLSDVYDGFERLRRYESDGAVLVAGHDPIDLVRFPRLPEMPWGAVVIAPDGG